MSTLVVEHSGEAFAARPLYEADAQLGKLGAGALLILEAARVFAHLEAQKGWGAPLPPRGPEAAGR